MMSSNDIIIFFNFVLQRPKFHPWSPQGKKSNTQTLLFFCFALFILAFFPDSSFCTAQNEWVICRVFKKSSGGKRIHISGLGTASDGADDSGCSNLPPLMDLSSADDEAQTRTTVAAVEASHVTCFSSNPIELKDEKPHPFPINHFNASSYTAASSSSKTNVFSLPSPSFPKVSTANSIFTSQIMPYAENLQYPDSIFMHDQSILKLLLEDYEPNSGQPAGTEVSQDTDMSSSPLSNHGTDLRRYGCSIAGVGQVDLDCLWNY